MTIEDEITINWNFRIQFMSSLFTI